MPDQDIATPAALRERIHQFQQSRVLLTAYELGLFTALADEERTSAGVATRRTARA